MRSACTRPLCGLWAGVLCEVPEHPRAQEARRRESVSLKTAIIQKPAHQGRKKCYGRALEES